MNRFQRHHRHLSRRTSSGFYSRGSVGHSLLRTKTNREPAIESHASSIHRAWPVKKASAAPIVAIKSAKPASAQATKIRLSLNDLIDLPLAKAIYGTTGRATDVISDATLNDPWPLRFPHPLPAQALLAIPSSRTR